MRNLFLVCVLLFFLRPVFSQENYSFDYGRCTQYEMTMQEYAPDPDADALVIYEQGKNFFTGLDHEGLMLFMDKTIKIKILKQAGIKYGEFVIPYYVDDESERVEKIEAVTYNLVDGKLTKTNLEPQNIFDVKDDAKWRVKKFALPDVKEGSVIEVKYRIATPFHFQMRDWKFQKRIPVLRSRLELRMIPYYVYSFIAKNITNLDVMESKEFMEEHRFRYYVWREKQYILGMDNLPAFRDEEFIASDKNFIKGITFELSQIIYPEGGKRDIMSTWPLICSELLKTDEFGKYLKNSEKEAKKIIPSLQLEGKTDVEKLKIIVEYVKSNYNWNEISAKYARLSPQELLTKKIGNSADLNLFLIGLLKTAGLSVDPIVLSTRSNGFVNIDYPFVSLLNYVIAKVDINGSPYFVDGTVSLLPFDELPERCLNVAGLVVAPKSDLWVIVKGSDQAETETKFNVSLNPDLESAIVEMKVTSTSHDAYSNRSLYIGDVENIRKKMKNYNIIPEGEIKVENYNKLSSPFVYSFSFTTNIEKTGNKLFVAPFFRQAPSQNIFKQKNREFPIDLMRINEKKFYSSIEIPKGYKLDYAPRDASHNGKQMIINYTTKQVDGRLIVEANFKFKLDVYDAKDYPLLKSIYESMVTRFNEMIVFVKE